MSDARGLLPDGRLERHSLALGLLVLAGAALLVTLAAVAVRGFPFSERWPVAAIVPADAPPLKDGDEVRVGGARFGQVRRVEPRPDGALVRMEIDEGPVGLDARVRVRVRGLSSVPYVEIERGDLARPLPAEATIPREHTTANPELADVLDVFDPPARRSLRRVVPTLGAGVLGRGDDLNATLADLEPALRGTTPLLRAVNPRPSSLRTALFNARRLLRALAPPGSRELEALIPAAATTLETIAARAREVERSVELLAPVEAEAARTLPIADALLLDARAALVELRPGARGLRDSLPEVDRLLRRDTELRSAARLARSAEPVLARTRPLLVELRPTTDALAAILRPLGSLIGELARYDDEIRLAAERGQRVTEERSPQGRASGRRAVRTVPVFTCNRPREPYPEPGESVRQRRACRG